MAKRCLLKRARPKAKLCDTEIDAIRCQPRLATQMTPRTPRSTLERQKCLRAFSLMLRVAQVVCWVKDLSTQSWFKIVRLLQACSMDGLPIHAKNFQFQPPAPTLMRSHSECAIYCYYQHPVHRRECNHVPKRQSTRQQPSPRQPTAHRRLASQPLRHQCQ